MRVRSDWRQNAALLSVNDRHVGYELSAVKMLMTFNSSYQLPERTQVSSAYLEKNLIFCRFCPFLHLSPCAVEQWFIQCGKCWCHSISHDQFRLGNNFKVDIVNIDQKLMKVTHAVPPPPPTYTLARL